MISQRKGQKLQRGGDAPVNSVCWYFQPCWSVTQCGFYRLSRGGGSYETSLSDTYEAGGSSRGAP